MKNFILFLPLLVFLVGCTSENDSQKESFSKERELIREERVVKGDPDNTTMPTYASVFDGIAISSDLTTFFAMMSAADLGEMLYGPGPITVFVPHNAAFDRLPAETQESLLQSENKAKLGDVLTSYIIAQELMTKDLIKMIADDGGSASVETVLGSVLTFKRDGENIMMSDENGNTATIITRDNMHSNGVTHVIDAVFLPVGMQLTTPQ